MKLKNYVSAIGIALALCLFVAATMNYPGGTTDSPNTVGYSWTHNFISTLFAPRALNGEANPARYFAVLSMLSLCLSIGLMFKQISTRVRSRVHGKTIEIAGIGTAVYSFLVVTRMHDLMVTIGLVFSLVALVATAHALYAERRWLLFGWGSLCIAVTLLGATMYYGNVFYGFLPVVQKVIFVSSIGWVLAVYYSLISRQVEATTLSTAIAAAPGRSST